MRIVSYGDFTLGALRGDEIVALSAVSRLPWDERLPALVSAFSLERTAIEGELKSGTGAPLASARLRAPDPRPPKMLCAIGNYGTPPPPDSPLDVDFTFKSPESIVGPGDAVVLDNVPATGFEAEATLAVIIGREARKVDEKDALSYVFGYTAMLDVFAAGLGRPQVGTFFGKSLDTLGPMGPWIVTADELGDPQSLRIRLTVNGATVQDFNTAQMILPVAGVLRSATAIMTLNPGDVLTCGSPTEPKVLLKDGDNVRVEIDRIGALDITVSDPQRRSWPAAAR